LPEQLQKIIDNLSAFGARRLIVMGGVAAAVMAIVTVAALYLNRPAYETLYVGLERADVNQIGLVLGEAGISFDVASDGTTVLVPVGKTAQARMLLAEKGLPTSTNAGYELFDNVGSLGLTSFMQQVTRVRALEGEIARTIQSIEGIRAARVHIVMAERASFRRDEQRPSASVVIRAASAQGERAAVAIRHMVAAAVPGLESDDVTVLDSSGRLLASGDDPTNTSINRALTVEQTVEGQMEDNIRRALSPYLGTDNFRVSVKAEVNTDSRQTEEVVFDPDSRVERSVQVVRTNDASSQQREAAPASVDQNLPNPDQQATAGPTTSEQSERREETTNYELNSKRTATVSNGYSIGRLSVAVVVNRARIAEVVGQGATPEQIDARIAEIRTLVASATGLNDARGDVVNVSAVEFVDGASGLDPYEAGILESLGRHTGTMINAGAFVLVVFLLVWFGLRPVTASLRKETAELEGPSFDAVQRSLPQPDQAPQLGAAGMDMALGAPGSSPLSFEPQDEMRRRIKPAPQERLARMVDLNEERTAMILRKWAGQEEAA
jgi:flagellar M-ring protein FliF